MIIIPCFQLIERGAGASVRRERREIRACAPDNSRHDGVLFDRRAFWCDVRRRLGGKEEGDLLRAHCSLRGDGRSVERFFKSISNQK
jgi:hypothetical protein